MTADIRTAVHAGMVRSLVMRAMTCPRSGEVLDVRTCVVLLDDDGDPTAVLSQRGWRTLPDDIRADLTTAGVTVDPTTVRGSREASMAVHPAGKRAADQPALFEVIGETTVTL